MITDEGNAIVEGTVAGTAYSSVSDYKPIINGVTVQDIVYRGHAALTDDGRLYGGHLGNGKQDSKSVLLGQQLSLERFNDEKKAEQITPSAEPKRTELAYMLHMLLGNLKSWL